MLLQIFGLRSEPDWWILNHIPQGGGAELSGVLCEQVAGESPLRFFTGDKALEEYSDAELAKLWESGKGYLVAKPCNARTHEPSSLGIRLVTLTGPDAGRIFPLSRTKLTVGRGESRAQVRDPWLSAHHFNIRLTSEGTLIQHENQAGQIWCSEEPHSAGSTDFILRRGMETPLLAPRIPEDFTVDPGQPPSPPNLVLQIMGAAAPLLIGIVLMLVTGMWYFLLFSGISVVIAIVLISQYRRARKRFITAIAESLRETTQTLNARTFDAHEMILALTTTSHDPLALGGDQPEHPVISLGSGRCKATLSQTPDTTRWEPFLCGRIKIVLCLEPHEQTYIIGDPASCRPVRNWIMAQLLRHARATNTGIVVDGTQIGHGVTVELIDHHPGKALDDRHHIIFVNDSHLVPKNATTIINLASQTVQGATTATHLRPLGISRSTLQRLYRELQFDAPANLQSPEYLTLSQTVMQHQAVDRLATIVSAGTQGLTIDLVNDGPHMLITGTTGSGKSELLLTVIFGLAQQYPPTEVSLILLDFKGGASFNIFDPLPHTMSVETNHVAVNSFRSLEAIAAELHRREKLFSTHGVADYHEFRTTFPNEVLPRLVVAIDELRVLVDQNSDAPTRLARLAATGRSLGFHLIIATQRTQGAVNPDIRANIGCVITLRTATEHDSWDTLGTADGFRIPTSRPGLAYFKSGANVPRKFQTHRYVLDNEPLQILPYSPSVDSLAGTTAWPEAVRFLRDKAQALVLPNPVILPSLPERVTTDILRSVEAEGSRARAIGLVDHPAECAQYPVHLALTDNSRYQDGVVLEKSVAWVGAPDSGLLEATQYVMNQVVTSSQRRILLEGRHITVEESQWDTTVHMRDATPDMLQQFLEDLLTGLEHGAPSTIVITEWGSWANAMVTGSFQGFEDRLVDLLRQFPTQLRVYVFGGRELASGRLIAMIPDRFYIPKNSSAEHRLIWPPLIDIPAVRARAVMITAGHPARGLEVQLCGT